MRFGLQIQFFLLFGIIIQEAYTGKLDPTRLEDPPIDMESERAGNN